MSFGDNGNPAKPNPEIKITYDVQTQRTSVTHNLGMQDTMISMMWKEAEFALIKDRLKRLADSERRVEPVTTMPTGLKGAKVQ